MRGHEYGVVTQISSILKQLNTALRLNLCFVMLGKRLPTLKHRLQFCQKSLDNEIASNTEFFDKQIKSKNLTLFQRFPKYGSRPYAFHLASSYWNWIVESYVVFREF